MGGFLSSSSKVEVSSEAQCHNDSTDVDLASSSSPPRKDLESEDPFSAVEPFAAVSVAIPEIVAVLQREKGFLIKLGTECSEIISGGIEDAYAIVACMSFEGWLKILQLAYEQHLRIVVVGAGYKRLNSPCAPASSVVGLDVTYIFGYVRAKIPPGQGYDGQAILRLGIGCSEAHIRSVMAYNRISYDLYGSHESPFYGFSPSNIIAVDYLPIHGTLSNIAHLDEMDIIVMREFIAANGEVLFEVDSIGLVIVTDVYVLI